MIFFIFGTFILAKSYILGVVECECPMQNSLSVQSITEVRFKLDRIRQAVRMGSLTFIIAVVVTLVSTGLAEVVSLPVALLILFVIILIGILFDVIGVSATAAEMAPLNAKAAKKIFGAKKALFLLRRADVVASFCCDIVGDICGTISGALGAVIVLRLSTGFQLSEDVLEVLFLALIASLMVGGKAYGKRIGIERANDIIFVIGKVLATIELVFHFRRKKDNGGEVRWLSLKRSTTRRNSKS
jgi:hypothetical protein